VEHLMGTLLAITTNTSGLYYAYASVCSIAYDRNLRS
jgi:hypothetical protein